MAHKRRKGKWTRINRNVCKNIHISVRTANSRAATGISRTHSTEPHRLVSAQPGEAPSSDGETELRPRAGGAGRDAAALAQVS